ncbi:methylated-DNA--[protein]-cysteine S-methyltransferase [Candidatus Woesearchaeota archaeon]|nr:methylated-DNA--[protein]-cysteine S-methyltransferase [Candidatus Woesearchaeota archaeon]
MIANFQEKVYSLCKRVPEGKVTTYGEIAKSIGKTGLLSRAVGNALNKNPYAPVIPCHRVVKSDGSIGGFASGSRKKINLLRKEGISIKNNKIIDFKKRLYRLK